jgi:hypothetical protein
MRPHLDGIYSEALVAFAKLVAAKAIAELESQEPVAWADHGVVNWIADKQFKHASLLYTHPPQRTWVGLTDEEIKKTAKKHRWHESNVSPHLMPVFRSLEAKLKEKNT